MFEVISARSATSVAKLPIVMTQYIYMNWWHEDEGKVLNLVIPLFIKERIKWFFVLKSESPNYIFLSIKEKTKPTQLTRAGIVRTEKNGSPNHPYQKPCRTGGESQRK